MCEREANSASLLEFGFLLSCKTQLLFLLSIFNHPLLLASNSFEDFGMGLTPDYLIYDTNLEQAPSSSRIHWEKCLYLHLHISSAWCVRETQEEAGLKEGKMGGIEGGK